MDEPVPAKYPDRRIMTAEQVVRFGSDRAPIEGTQVHLARYVAGDWVLNRTRSGVVFSSDDDITGGEPNVLVTALCVLASSFSWSHRQDLGMCPTRTGSPKRTHRSH